MIDVKKYTIEELLKRINEIEVLIKRIMVNPIEIKKPNISDVIDEHEVLKQIVLVKVHLQQARDLDVAFCLDCIKKHFSTIIAFCEKINKPKFKEIKEYFMKIDKEIEKILNEDRIDEVINKIEDILKEFNLDEFTTLVYNIWGLAEEAIGFLPENTNLWKIVSDFCYLIIKNIDSVNLLSKSEKFSYYADVFNIFRKIRKIIYKDYIAKGQVKNYFKKIVEECFIEAEKVKNNIEKISYVINCINKETSEAGIPDGVVVNYAKARSTPCVCYNYKLPDGKETDICFSKGVIGQLSEEQELIFCNPRIDITEENVAGTEYEEGYYALKERLSKFVTARKECWKKVEHIEDPAKRMLEFFKCFAEKLHE